MAIFHEVLAVPPGKRKQQVMGTYEEARWQWAVKQAAWLEDKGFADVEVTDREEDEEEADDEIEK